MEVKFRKALFAWEKDEMVRLVNLLQLALTTGLYQEDRAVWKASSSGIFSTASMYNWLESANGPISKISRLLWQNIAPPKVQFFGWGAWKGKVKTSVFLKRIDILNGSTSTSCVL